MRLLFVVPRFAESIAGGAETLVAQLATRLRFKHQVEIVTTCAIDNRTWDNFFPAGTTEELGLKVTRFPVSERNLDKWVPKQIAICEGMNLTLEDQLDWMEHSVNSHQLYQFLADNVDNYDYYIFAPYLFGTTFWGSLICPQKSILIPCLHNEYYAFTDVIANMFYQVSACMFNAAAEQRLAERLYGSMAGGEVGMGFDLHPEEYVKNLKPYFAEKFAYILYLGRKETGKNVQLLVDNFIQLKTESPSDLKLVIAGGGSFDDLHRPEALQRDDIIDIGHVTEAEKHSLIRFADVLCQPSTNESFSIVLMESWLLGTPVLVHAECEVTREHAVLSGGGLYFSDIEDFIAVTKELVLNPNLRKEMGSAGFDYVRNFYSWQAVLERFDKVLEIIDHDKQKSSGQNSTTSC